MLFLEDFQGMGCSNPDCDKEGGCGHEMFLHSHCHPKSPTWAKYDGGVLVIVCAECEAAVCQIAVASREA